VREALGASGIEAMYEFADALIASDAGRALTLIGRAMDAGRDAMVLAREMTAQRRALHLAQMVPEGLEDLLECTREEARRLAAQASGASAEGLTRWMELFMRAEGDMKWAAQPRSALELAAVRCCRPEKEQSPEALVERLAKLEALLQNRAAAPFDPAPAPAAPAAPAPAAPRPAAPKPAPAASNPQEAPGAEGYRAALDIVAKEQPPIFGMLKDAAFRGVEGDSVLLELPRARAFYRQILEKDDKKALIDQALARGFGRPVTVRFVQGGEAAPRAGDRRILEQAYDVFGREKVSVLDE
jgi:DNA polymerase III gamma/tau subunit